MIIPAASSRAMTDTISSRPEEPPTVASRASLAYRMFLIMTSPGPVRALPSDGPSPDVR